MDCEGCGECAECLAPEFAWWLWEPEPGDWVGGCGHECSGFWLEFIEDNGVMKVREWHTAWCEFWGDFAPDGLGRAGADRTPEVVS